MDQNEGSGQRPISNPREFQKIEDDLPGSFVRLFVGWMDGHWLVACLLQDLNLLFVNQKAGDITRKI